MRPVALSRRAMLRGTLGGAAVQIALPRLEAMAQTAPPVRFIVWFWGNGRDPGRWTPAAVGPNWPLSEQLAPLEKVRDYVSVVTGTAVKVPQVVAHHSGQIGIMTGAGLINKQNGTLVNTTVTRPSIDQIAAAAIGKSTRFRSLEVGVLTHNQTSEGDGILFVSHNGPYSPNPQETDPAKVFGRLFGADFTPPGAKVVTDATLPLRRSVLDAVLVDLGALRQRVGAADARRLDQHADNVRAIEKRLVDLPSAAASPTCRRPDAPGSTAGLAGIDLYRAVNKAMSDLVAMALACDLTRVVTYQYSGGGNHEVYQAFGSSSDNHTLNHEEPDPQPISNKITIFTMQELAAFLGVLRATPEGPGNLLDSSSVFCTSEIANGKTHSQSDFAILVAGRAGGRLKYPGVHYRSPSRETAAMPTVSALRAAGVPLASFGDGDAFTQSGLSAIEA